MDGAKEFYSADMEDWADGHDIHRPHPPPHNPTGNSAVERFSVHYNARVAASDVYLGGQLLDSRVAFEWNVQQTRHLGFSPFEVMVGTPVVTQVINYARGVMGPRAHEPTAERAELIECLQQPWSARRRHAATRPGAQLPWC